MTQSQPPIPDAETAKRLMSLYHMQIGAVIETERLMVAYGLIQPSERRILSRDERRGLTKKREMM